MKGLFHGEWRRGQMFHPETCWSWSRELFGEVLIILNYKESVIMTWGNDTSHTWVQCQPAHQGWVYFYLINTWRRSPSYVMIDNPPSLFRVLSSVTVSQPPGNPNQQRIGQWQQLAADWTITGSEKNTINCKGLSWILERPIIMILVNNFPELCGCWPTLSLVTQTHCVLVTTGLTRGLLPRGLHPCCHQLSMMSSPTPRWSLFKLRQYLCDTSRCIFSNLSVICFR